MQSKTAGVIYANRKSKGLTQEQLADIVGVSPVAVSKWERGISIPNVDVLCKLADYFQVTVDEILGRNIKAIQENDLYSAEVLKRLEVGELLLKCCEVSRKGGLLAMEQLVCKEDTNDFLRFSVKFLLDGLQKEMLPEQIFQMLRNYAQNESDVKSTCMITEILSYIVAGENEAYIREWLASFLGKEYRDKLVQESERRKFSYEQILVSYDEKVARYVGTDLLESLVEASDEVLRQILKNVDNQTLIVALAGASGEVCKRFLRNLSERLLYYVDEDIQRCKAGETKIRAAQKKVLEIAGRYGILNRKSKNFTPPTNLSLPTKAFT